MSEFSKYNTENLFCVHIVVNVTLHPYLKKNGIMNE